MLLQLSSLYPLDKLDQSRRYLQTPGHTYFLLLTWCDHVKYRYTSLLEEEIGDTTDQLCSVFPMAPAGVRCSYLSDAGVNLSAVSGTDLWFQDS